MFTVAYNLISLTLVAHMSFALEGTIRVADIAKDLAKLGSVPIILERNSMMEVKSISTAKTAATIESLKSQIQLAGMEVLEANGIAIVTKEKHQLDLLQKQLERQIPFCEISDARFMSINFPEPTDISDISRALSLWLDVPLVMDNNFNDKVQILAANKVDSAIACRVWVAALNLIGLELLESNGVVTILPQRMVQRWTWPILRQNTLEISKTEELDFNFLEPSSVNSIVNRYNELTKSKIYAELNDEHKITIIGAQKTPMSKLSFLLEVALSQAGLSIDGSKVINKQAL